MRQFHILASLGLLFLAVAMIQAQDDAAPAAADNEAAPAAPPAAAGAGDDAAAGQDGEKEEECEEAWDYVEFMKKSIKWVTLIQ